MNGIRWYAMDRVTYTPLVSPITRAPYVITLPDRAAAMAWCARSFPHHVVTPMSVMEYDAMEHERATKRARERWARQVAREAEQMNYILNNDPFRLKELDAHYAARRAWRGSELHRALRGVAEAA